MITKLKSNVKLKESLLGVFIFIIYIVFGIIAFPSKDNIEEFNALYYIICMLFTIALITYVYINDLKVELKDFFKKFFKNILKCFGLFILLFLIITIGNFLIDNFLGWTKLNTDTLIFPNMKALLPYTIFALVIYTPFIEGIVFTKVLNKIINHKVIWILLSGLLYGFMQAGFDFSNLLMIVSSIPYVIIGIIVAIVYEKKKNVFFPIFIWLFYYLFQLLVQYMAL